MADLSSPTKNNVCVICLESLTNNGNFRTSSDGDDCIGTCVPCGHCFHVSCFDGWKSSCRGHGQAVKCPTCNTKSKDFCRLFLDFTDNCDPTNDDDDDDDSSCSSSCDDEDCDVEYISTSDDIAKNDHDIVEISSEPEDGNENGDENDNNQMEERNSDDDIYPFDIALLTSLNNDVNFEPNKKKRKRQDVASNDGLQESTKEDGKSKYKQRAKRYKQQLARMEAQSKQRVEECTKLLNSYNKQRTELSDVTNQLQTEAALRKEYERSNEMLNLQKVRMTNQLEVLQRDISTEQKMYSELRTKYQQMEDSYRIDVENARATSLKEVHDILQQRPKLINENKSLKEVLANKENEIVKLRKQLGIASTSTATNNNNATKASNSSNTGIKAAKMLAKINNAIELTLDNSEKTKSAKDLLDTEIIPSQSKKPPHVFSSHAARMVSRASSLENQQSHLQQRHHGSSQGTTTANDSTMSATQEAKNFVCSLMTQSTTSGNKSKKQSFTNFVSNTQNKSFKTNGLGLSIREVTKPMPPKHQLQLNFRR